MLNFPVGIGVSAWSMIAIVFGDRHVLVYIELRADFFWL